VFGGLAVVLSIVFSSNPAFSQVGDEIFSEGFENPCGFEPNGPSARIDSITIGTGSAGAQVTVNGFHLEATAYRVFLRGPRPSASTLVELAIDDRQVDRLITRLDDPLRVGRYDVILQTCDRELVLPAAYATPTFGPDFVQPGNQVVMSGERFGTEPGSVVVDESGLGLSAGIVSWIPGQVVLAINGAHDVNGPVDVRIDAEDGTLRLQDALVIFGLDDGSDQDGPRLVSASATSNTTILAQFSEAIVGGPDGAEDPSLYRITAPGFFPTVTVLSADVLPPDYTRVRLTTMSQSDLVYTLEVSGIQDLSGNPLASPTLGDDPTQTDFAGLPAGPGNVIDSDGDGLTDAAEQRGWSVSIQLADGTSSSSYVTSDPGDPRLPIDDPVNVAARDTDGDGVFDDDEKRYSLNPRSADTDDDGLSDNAELNEVYSGPADQDTDGDTLADGLEFDFFRTSPILADTDGDQLTDDVEVSLANRNPLIADLPAPTIEVGQSNLQLDVRFLESTSQSTNEIEARSVSSTLTQDSSRSISNTNSNTQEAMAKLTVGAEYEVKGSITGPEATFSSSIEAETGWTGSWTSSHTAESTQSTQQAYQDSLEETVEVAEGASVSREVVGASMQVTLSLKSTNNLAYFLRNLQVTALKQDALDPTVLTPVATLLPDAEPSEGYSLGPLNPERGPIILSSTTVFPQQVEDLMRNPRGLIFKISNFDIVDELGRNFAFTSQDINDRTATLVIDNGSFDEDGDGEGDLTEYERVATGSGRTLDTNGDGIIDAQDRRVVFDPSGRQVGVTLTDALDALGLERYREDCPPGDASPECRPTDTLSPSEIENSYSVQFEGDNGQIERIYRIRGTAKDNINPKAWEIITATGIDTSRGLGELVLETESDLKLAFVQDLDQDRLTDGLEFINRCLDFSDEDEIDSTDTDGDMLDDRFEVLIGWDVETGRGTRRVFSSCASDDSDGDGVPDLEEAPGTLVYAEGEPGDPLLIISATPSGEDDYVTDPSRADTDEDGVNDFDEINGYSVDLRDGTTVFVTTDPNNPDTDGDTASDGLERRFGGDPTVPDLDSFSDADGDGLVNILEQDGWDVVVETVSTSPVTCNTICDPGAPVTTSAVTSDPLVADTDMDGLLDSEERELGTNPRLADSDGDGLTDAQEVLGVEIRDLGIVYLDPLDQDTDDDKRSDGMEAELIDDPGTHWIVRVEGQTPYRVFSDPTRADEDFDTLVDGDERAALGTGTDPTKADTDEDGRSDAQEIVGSTNPLAEDFRVTVRYHQFQIGSDCEDGDAQNAGEFHFNLGVRVPSTGSFRSIVNPQSLSTAGLVDPSCPNPNDTLCFGFATVGGIFTPWVRFDDGGDFQDRVDLDSFDTSFGINASQEFSLAGRVREVDENENGLFFDPRLDFQLDDRFNRTLDVNGTMRSGFFTGSELSDGPITGIYRNEAVNGCGDFTLEVSIVPEN
jgi:hypothetical protein